MNAWIGGVHTREAGPRGVSDADRSLLVSTDVHPAYGPRARARSRARARLKPRIGRVPGRRRRRGSPGGFDRCSGARRRAGASVA